MRRTVACWVNAEPKNSENNLSYATAPEASMDYNRGAKLLEIKQMLGHTSIKGTIVYTHLVEPTESDEYISRATRSVARARALIEAGFQYVCEMDGLKLFRKRK